MKFRRASAADCPQIVDLVNALISELGGKALDVGTATAASERLTANPEMGVVVVAVDTGGAVAGICGLSYQAAIRTIGRYAIVQEMYVVPGQRGRGVGAEMLRRAMGIASRSGCKVVELGTPPESHRQERFYESEGFDTIGLRMRKVLAD